MEFTKMHCCGNDFCVVDYKLGVDYSELAKTLCNRRLGIGADGIVVVKLNPLDMELYDAEGRKETRIGNELFCFARYAFEKKIFDKKLEYLIPSGVVKLNLTSSMPFLVKIEMGKPIFVNQMLHISDDINSFGRLCTVDGYRLTIYSLFLSDIHTVIFVDDLNSPILHIASKISSHPLFKRKTTVNFVHILGEKAIEIRTYERNVGFVLCNGSGACASVITCAKLGLTKGNVLVNLECGTFKVEVTKKENVFLEGSAQIICQGIYNKE